MRFSLRLLYSTKDQQVCQEVLHRSAPDLRRSLWQKKGPCPKHAPFFLPVVLDSAADSDEEPACYLAYQAQKNATANVPKTANTTMTALAHFFLYGSASITCALYGKVVRSRRYALPLPNGFFFIAYFYSFANSASIAAMAAFIFSTSALIISLSMIVLTILILRPLTIFPSIF